MVDQSVDIDILSPSQVFSPARFKKTGRGSSCNAPMKSTEGIAALRDGHPTLLEQSTHSSTDDNAATATATTTATAGHCSPVTNSLTVLADSCIASAEKDRTANNGLFRYTTSLHDNNDDDQDQCASYRVSPSPFNPLSDGIAATGIGRSPNIYVF